MWLSRTGYDVKFRNPDVHLRKDGNTSDSLVDGATCDYKRATPASMKKAVREITAKLDRQGPGFVLDLSAGKLGADEARTRVAMLLDEPKIERVYLVSKDGSIETLKK